MRDPIVPPSLSMPDRGPARLGAAAGYAVIALGGVVMLGWLLRQPLLVQFAPGYTAMVFGTALGFVLMGGALLLAATAVRQRRVLQTLFAALTLALAAAELVRYNLGVDLGTDLPALHTWLDGQPKRMAPNTALAFALAAVALLVNAHGRGTALGTAALLLALGVVLLGVVGLIGYELRPELLFGWAVGTRMALHTAAGFVLLGAGLVADIYRRRDLHELYRRREDLKIGLLGGAVLALVTVVAGLSAFLLLQQQTEANLRNSLQLALKNRADFFANEIERGLVTAATIATRPAIRRELVRLREDPGNRDAQRFLVTAVTSFLDLGLSAVRLYDARGRLRVDSGRFADPAAQIRLAGLTEADLLWHQGLLLRVRMPVAERGVPLGTIVVERPMPALTRLLYDVHGVGGTGEMLVCAARDEARVHCLPTRLEPAAFDVPRRMDGQPLPIALAVEGRSGTIIAADFRRQNVLAAYSPLDGIGLGMVLKVDTAEVYRPIRRQLEKSLLLLAVLVTLGVLLLRWRLLPLVSRLVESEAVARAAYHELRESEARYRAVAESANDAILSVDADGRILSWNPAAERLFGYAVHEILGQPVASLMPERYRAAHAAGLERMRAGGESRVLGRTVEMHGLRRDGGEFPLELSLADWTDGETRYYTGIARDITERKRAEETIRELSLTDELTGLRNRRGFITLAQVELALARRMRRALRLFFLDLDRMKEINDRFGHGEGDRALRDMGELLRRSFRETDIVARLGGDEFVVLALEDRLHEPDQITERIQLNVAAHNRTAGRPYRLSVSIGAVRYHPGEHADIEQFLAAGDAEMYKAKQRVATAR